MTTRHLRITGHVQGVSFRAFVKHHADALGLDGFVRNRKDGSVEALISGEAEKVEALIAECHKGPPASRVENIEINETEETLQGRGFRHLSTV